MEKLCKELPENCWELILSKLDYHQWEPLSLVSKKFLSITNHLRSSLKIILPDHPSIGILAKLLQRFPNLKIIDLADLVSQSQEQALLSIARSELDIEELNVSCNSGSYVMLLKDLGNKMRNFKVFKCSKSYLTDNDLMIIADSFPSLEELDVSEQHNQRITDEGIVTISMRLKCLRKINLTGNRKISDQSIISLSTNCKFLTEIVHRYCYNVSQIGISFAMENSPSYSSLILASNSFHPLEITNHLKYSACVSTIDLYGVNVSDEFLDGIVRAVIPLKNLHLSDCKNFTFDGLFSLLKAYPSLESLDLSQTEVLTDTYVIYISQFIKKLISIKLDYCSDLTVSSFITIASACPVLRTFKMSSSSRAQINPENVLQAAKNQSITSVSLPSFALNQVLPICSNLQVLRVNCFHNSTELDIAYILNSCHDLRYLTLDHCQKLKFEEDDEEEICKLERFSAGSSRINDEKLKMVAKRCPELQHLNLKYCMDVTECGVREVAKHCKKLRYVNLDFCLSVKKDVVAWMVESCASLRQIVTPNPTDHSRWKIEGFLRQGCLVIPGSEEQDFYWN